MYNLRRVDPDFLIKYRRKLLVTYPKTLSALIPDPSDGGVQLEQEVPNMDLQAIRQKNILDTQRIKVSMYTTRCLFAPAVITF